MRPKKNKQSTQYTQPRRRVNNLPQQSDQARPAKNNPRPQSLGDSVAENDRHDVRLTLEERAHGSSRNSTRAQSSVQQGALPELSPASSVGRSRQTASAARRRPPTTSPPSAGAPPSRPTRASPPHPGAQRLAPPPRRATAQLRAPATMTAMTGYPPPPLHRARFRTIPLRLSY